MISIRPSSSSRRTSSNIPWVLETAALLATTEQVAARTEEVAAEAVVIIKNNTKYNLSAIFLQVSYLGKKSSNTASFY